MSRWLKWVPADRPLALVALAMAVTWVPLVVLTAAEGHAIGDDVALPFLRDAAANVRLLVTLPLLILGAKFGGARLRETQLAFEETGIIDDRSRGAFREIIRSSAAVVHSPWSDAAALAIAVATVLLIPFPFLAREGSWLVTGSGERASLTRAGWWLVAIVLPLYRFLLLRWTLRFVVWSIALGRIARLDLRLLPTHADRSAGLGFVGRGQKAFAPLVLALSTLIAADLSNDVLQLGVTVQELKRPIGLFVGISLGVWIAPLGVFMFTLVRLKRQAMLEYDALAARSSRTFDTEWLRTEGRDAKTMLGVEDVQSLAALQEVCDTVRRMKPLPLDGPDLMALVAVTLLPMLPLVLSTIPPAELQELLRTVVA